MAYTEHQAEDAAAHIVSARLERSLLGPLPETCRPRTAAEGYRVQDTVHEQLAAAGRGATVGHKIGCTTPVMQAYLGIANPCAGGVLELSVNRLEGTFVKNEQLRIGVECELALMLGGDLDVPAVELSVDRVAQAVESIAVAIEIVEDRYDDYSSVGTPTLIADDFFGAGCVLGAPCTAWRALDLAAIEATMSIDGELVGRGTGADLLGHPLEALRWLAAARAARGRPVRAGEFVLLGSVVQTTWVDRGAAAVAESPQLGVAKAWIA